MWSSYRVDIVGMSSRCRASEGGSEGGRETDMEAGREDHEAIQREPTYCGLIDVDRRRKVTL